ncbi:MAG: uroporphyrinogen decarboxylase family protein [Victivallales bacterium]
MSRKRALDNIFLRKSDEIAHTEYSLGYHDSLVKKFAPARIDDAFELDFIWSINDAVNWQEKGRATNMGHAEYASDGSDKKNSGTCPFTEVEEIYEFDPVREYGLLSHRELVNFYEEHYQKCSAANPNQVFTGGYYKSVVSGAIEAFGWDMLLMAAADADKFAEVLRRIGDYTYNYNSAWADTSIDVFIQHDDMVWTQGPFMDPDFYRKVIFPIYRKLWEPLKKKGKKVLYCSDGTWDMFMKDIAECGADGFIFEPTNNFDYVVENFGSTHCIVGSKVDCRTMTFGTWEEVKKEMDETFALAQKCKGLIFAVGNHIPANISDEMCLKYLDYFLKNRKRK